MIGDAVAHVDPYRDTMTLYTTREVCGLLHCSRSTLFRLMDDGRLPWVMLRGQRRIRAIDLAAFLDNLS